MTKPGVFPPSHHSHPTEYKSRRDLLDPDEIARTADEAVIVGGDYRVSFNDVLFNRLPSPFDWASFASVATKRFYVEENIRFVEDYRAKALNTPISVEFPEQFVRQSGSLSTKEVAKITNEWYAKYIGSDGEYELNVPAGIKRKVMERKSSLQRIEVMRDLYHKISSYFCD